MKIKRVHAREIYDSRGWPTVQCEVWLDDGSVFSGYAPAGLSKSSYEARELRDGDKRLWGKGVRKAVENINDVISPVLVGKEPIATDLDYMLITLDGTPDKSHLGANAMIATSMALYRAYAHDQGIELYELIAFLIGAQSVSIPCPMFNIINGGRHAENTLNVQEFMYAPLSAETLREGIDSAIALFHEIKHILRKQGVFFGIGDEGGITAPFDDPRTALDVMMQALEKVSIGSEAGVGAIALDVAATQFYDSNKKRYIVNGNPLTSEELIVFYKELVKTYPIYSIEDGMAEDDWEGWVAMYEALSDEVQLAADDILATNPERLVQIAEQNCATAMVIKPNQIGTVTEALELVNACKSNNLNTIVSHRSGETEDSFIADFAVGTSAGQLKAGGVCRSERMAKYNRLLAIEDILLVTGSSYGGDE